MKEEGKDYFYDPWNYLELSGITLFAWAGVLDIYNLRPTDTMRMLFVVSMLMCLVKVVYLVRVFKALNFLVTMFGTVVVEI